MIKKGLIDSYRGIFPLTRCIHSATWNSNYFSVSRTQQGNTEQELDKQTNVSSDKDLVIYNCRKNIDARPRKLNLLAKQVRCLPLSNAIQQMEFSVKKAATSIKEVLIETQDKAKIEHGITDASSLWVAESYVGRGFIEKNMIRHARGRYGRGRKAYTHYFVVVKEGLPKPKDQRRSHEEKTEFERYIQHQPKIMDSHAWW